jgi:release factor glutamine methyltransferase
VKRREALARARDILAKSDIEDASLEGEILLRHVLKIDRSQLYSDLDLELNTEQEKSLDKLLQRRRRGEPSAYITGHREFYGIDFQVDRRVLIPRPETELLVERVIEVCCLHPYITTIADIGTGCGAIAVTLAVILRDVKIRATDISAEALCVAVKNAAVNNVKSRISFLQGNLLEPLRGPVDLIVANLPYVKTADLPTDRFEPVQALDGGTDGLDKIREICMQVGGKLHDGGYLFLEVGEGQAKAVSTLLHDLYPGALPEVVRQDLAGIDRLICLRWKQEATST